MEISDFIFHLFIYLFIFFFLGGGGGKGAAALACWARQIKSLDGFVFFRLSYFGYSDLQ